MAEMKKQRTCVVCRKPAGKASLMRIVRSPEGAVSFDATGRAPGRGAYVCSVSCLEKALMSKRLDAALRVRLSEEDTQRIVTAVRSMLSGKEESK